MKTRAKRNAGRTPRAGFPHGLLDNGLVLGHTTETSARVWLRCERPEPHALVCRSDAGESRAIAVRPDPARDGTALIELSDLLPDHRYTLDLRDPHDRSVLAPWLQPQVRTLPRNLDRLAFGVMSCSLPFETDAHGLRAARERIYDDMFEALCAKDARFVVALGDQVYADEVSGFDVWERVRSAPDRDACARAAFSDLYRGFWAVPGQQRLRARFPHYMIWDDHEIRDDWGSRPRWRGPRGEVEASVFRAAREAYETYQHALNPVTAERTYHYAFAAGDVAVFVLDLRGQRSWDQGQLLGDSQWRDLTAWLATTERASVRFLVCSVPPHHVPERLIAPATRWLGNGPLHWLLPSTFYDRWCAGLFHRDLSRLIDLLSVRSAQSAPVILLAGDIHIGAAMEIQGKPGAAPIPQWITSAITTGSPSAILWASRLVCRATNLATHFPLRHQFEELRNNFAIVEVDLRGARPEAAFQLYAWNGRQAEHAHTVRLSLTSERAGP